MGSATDNEQLNVDGKEFQLFFWVRIVGGLVAAVLLIWVALKLIDLIQPGDGSHSPEILYSSDAHEDESSHDAAMHSENDPHATEQHSPDISHGAHGTSMAHTGPKGTAFVESLITPLEYELKERFWGWRPNDIIEFTDNVNKYQLGVLEVTRRATTRLTENISRTGSTAVINKYLERAMNSLMIRADRYLFPSAENQYLEAVGNLNRYKQQLIDGQAEFYNRADNLIPLLQSLVELVGSCDESLVKMTEEDGSTVSTFKADNYYYYAKGVASALLPVLHAIEYDFRSVLDVRSSTDILHHAIEACHHASDMEPWLFVTESNPNGIFANHRANMAAPISHVRFYLGLLITTLST